MISPVLALIGLVPVLLGSALILIGAVTGRRRHRSWQRTVGFKVVPNDFRLGGVVYRFQAGDGRWFEGQSQVATTPFGDGAPMSVLYDPENPSYSVIDSPIHRGVIFIAVGAVIAALGVLAVVVLLVLASVPAPVIGAP